MKRIAFITDVHLNEQFPVDNGVDARKNLTKVIDDLKERNIKEVVFGGDIGEPSAHRYFFEQLKSFSTNVILGNHDTFDKVSSYYKKGLSDQELYYLFEDEHYRFLFLDTSSDELSDVQLEWLQRQIQTSKVLIVFIHHPILEIDAAVDKIYPLKNREQLKTILVRSKKEITIFTGHYHMNDEQTVENIRQITTQAISFQLLKNAGEIRVDSSNFGYRIIRLENGRIDTEVVTF